MPFNKNTTTIGEMLCMVYRTPLVMNVYQTAVTTVPFWTFAAWEIGSVTGARFGLGLVGKRGPSDPTPCR